MAMKDFNSDNPESSRSNEVSASWETAVIDKEIEEANNVLNPNKDFDPTENIFDYQEKVKEFMDTKDDNIIKKRAQKHRKNKQKKKRTSNKTQIKLLNKRVKKLENCINNFIEHLNKLQDRQTNYSSENAQNSSDEINRKFGNMLNSIKLEFGQDASKTSDDDTDKKVSDDQMKETKISNEHTNTFYKPQDDILNEQKDFDMHETSLNMHQFNLNVIKRSETSMALNYPTTPKNVFFPRGTQFVPRPRKTVPKGPMAVFVRLSEVEL